MVRRWPMGRAHSVSVFVQIRGSLGGPFVVRSMVTTDYGGRLEGGRPPRLFELGAHGPHREPVRSASCRANLHRTCGEAVATFTRGNPHVPASSHIPRGPSQRGRLHAHRAP